MHILLAALVGLIGGIGLGYLIFSVAKGRAASAKRITELQTELDTYKDQVQEHFTKTSELFQGLTEQYRELYQHLAHGAQSLCSPSPATPELQIAETEILPRAEETTETGGETGEPKQAAETGDTGETGTDQERVVALDSVRRTAERNAETGKVERKQSVS